MLSLESSNIKKNDKHFVALKRLNFGINANRILFRSANAFRNFLNAVKHNFERLFKFLWNLINHRKFLIKQFFYIKEIKKLFCAPKPN